MKIIHHYTITVGDDKRITLPEGSQVRHFGHRDGILTVWVEKPVHPPHIAINQSLKVTTLQVVGTGWEISDDYTYLQTMQYEGYVWHLYEKTK